MPDFAAQPPRHAMVLVTGSGRSGTSTVAGTLKRLGLSIPQPEVEADSKNPRGYYEPEWAIRFNKQLLKAVDVNNNDARPDAVHLTGDLASDADLRQELQGWLAEHLDAGQVVIKDPHILWLSQLWIKAARRLDVTPAFLTMLRHPTEVVGSRDMAYLTQRPEDFRRLRETANVAGWLNTMMVIERASRSHPRAFMRYTDLTEDWRTAMLGASKHLQLELNADLTSRAHHPVDDFIDPELRRSRLTWSDLDVPQQLRDLAESAWKALDALVDDPNDSAAMSELADLRTTYDKAHAHAVAFGHYHTEALLKAARKEVRDQLNAKHSTELARQRHRLRRNLQEQAADQRRLHPRQWLTRLASKARRHGTDGS